MTHRLHRGLPWTETAEAIGGVVDVEGSAPLPTPGMCEAMSRSMCSGVNTEVSALSRAGSRLWSDGVAVIAGVSEGKGDGTTVIDDRGSPDATVTRQVSRPQQL